MGGTSTDHGAAFDFDGQRTGWRLFLGNGALGLHNPSPYLHGGKRNLRRLCGGARRKGWAGLMAQADQVESEVAGWLRGLDDADRAPLAAALAALSREL